MLTGSHHARADPVHVIYMDFRLYEPRQVRTPSKHSSDPGASLVLAALSARDLDQNIVIYTLRQSMNSGSWTVEKSAQTQISVPSGVCSPSVDLLVVGSTGTRVVFLCGNYDSCNNTHIAACSVRSPNVVGFSVPRTLWEIPEHHGSGHITFDDILGTLAVASWHGHVWVLDFG